MPLAASCSSSFTTCPRCCTVSRTRPMRRAGGGRNCGWPLPGPVSVDVELVALRVPHPDRVVVEPRIGKRAADGGAQVGQPARLRVYPRAPSLDRVRPLAAGANVEVQPVLDRLGLGLLPEPDARPTAVRVADPIDPVGQVLLGQADVAVVIVPGLEPSWGWRGLIAQRGGPEPGHPVWVGAVDDQLIANGHWMPPWGASGRSQASFQEPLTV